MGLFSFLLNKKQPSMDSSINTSGELIAEVTDGANLVNGKQTWELVDEFKNDIEVILGDIRDYDSVFSAMKNCDSVFHLAALLF